MQLILNLMSKNFCKQTPNSPDNKKTTDKIPLIFKAEEFSHVVTPLIKEAPRVE